MEMVPSNKLILSHAYCSDGFVSSYAFYKSYPDATFQFVVHDNPPPDVLGKDVIILDFSYPREVLLEMKAKAKSLILLDHHVSAQRTLGDLEFCHFSMDRSGAGMSWDYLNPGKPRPWIFDFVEDKDLWRFALPNSREVNCVIQSYPLTFEALAELEKRTIEDIVIEGTILLRHQRQMVSSIAKKAREITVCGYKVLCVNTCVLQSEVCGYLAINRPFSVSYFENEKGERIYSLRSKEGGCDVSKIAGIFGGGGHLRSSGCKLSPGQSIEGISGLMDWDGWSAVNNV